MTILQVHASSNAELVDDLVRLGRVLAELLLESAVPVLDNLVRKIQRPIEHRGSSG